MTIKTDIKSLITNRSLISNQSINENYISFIEDSKNSLFLHIPIVVVLSILYGFFSLMSNVSNLSMIYDMFKMLTFILGGTYCILTSTYIYTIVNRWIRQFTHGFNLFRANCVKLSTKNYRLMREYREIYHYHYGDVLSKCITNYKNGDIQSIRPTINGDANEADINNYVKYVLQNDTAERMESYEWIKLVVERVNKYVKLSYYLSFLKSTDKLDLYDQKIRINIDSESVLNKRNRKLENLVNDIPIEYRLELIGAWNAIDKNLSSNIMTIVPSKWILYEYRNLFRYFYCAKYLKLISQTFDKDYVDFEDLINNIGSSLQTMFCRENEYLPKHFTTIYTTISDVLVFVIDNLMALSLVNSFVSNSILVSLILTLLGQIVIVCTNSAVNDLIKKTENVIMRADDLKIDKNIESVFTEMNVLLIDGKTR